MDTIRIQLQFTEQTSHGEYRDTLYFTEAEYAKLQQKDIDALKQKRVNDWVAFVENPPPKPVPTKEEIEILIAEKERMVAELTQEKAELQAQLH